MIIFQFHKNSYFCKKIVIRIVENNDWVLFALLLVGTIYLVVFSGLLRGLSLKNFLSQSYDEAQNLLLCWWGISLGYIVVLSVLLSQYIPIVPRVVMRLEVGGWVLNKIGIMLVILLVFYFVKSVITVLFYGSIGQVKKYLVLGFVAQKFYFLQSLLLMILCVIHYYFPIDRRELYNYYLILLGLLFVGKNLFYLFHRQSPLPEEWYHKILYIWTLQVLPLLAVWKFIFLV